MIKRAVPLLFFLSFISAQIALPTFQAVHKPHNTSSSICGGTPETPWGSNSGSATGTGYGWSYMMGYKFTPQVDGCITKLGGYFDGSKTVRLWKVSSEELLAKVTVPDPNYSWTYADITSVSVTSGEQYYVAVAMGGSGGCYRNLGSGSNSFPNTYGNIIIDANTYRNNYDSDTYPNPPYVTNQHMYGMVDITFVPDS
tara:strand:+ start:51 stop:644 length:594 start_codon:yes stop_codon:yes gene_type:complete